METAQRGGIVPEWTFGDRLTKARKIADIDRVEDLAERLGLARQTVGGWENDHHKPVHFAVVRQIAQVTGVDVDWLRGQDYDETGRRIKNRCCSRSDQPELPFHETSTSNVHELPRRPKRIAVAAVDRSAPLKLASGH